MVNVSDDAKLYRGYNMKRFAAVILIMGLLILGVAGFFFYRGYIFNEWQYSDAGDGGIAICGYNGRAKDLVIPTEINGHSVAKHYAEEFSIDYELTD